jgi:rhodanese-related sulfurtransferase
MYHLLSSGFPFSGVHYLRHYCGLLLISILSFSAVAGGGIPTPVTLEGGQIITAKQAKLLFDQSAVLFIDTRGPLNYGRGHIPGALLVPYKGTSKKVENFDASLDSFDVTQLGGDKNRKIIIYSHGDTGWKSYKAAVLAIRDGFTQIMWMREGYALWKQHGYATE